MRVGRIFTLVFLGVLVVLGSVSARGSVSVEDAAKILPDQVGSFRAQGAPTAPSSAVFEGYRPEEFGALGHAARSYISARGEPFTVEVVKTHSDSDAYSLWTEQIRAFGSNTPRFGNIGTASISSPGKISFYKGPVVVTVYRAAKQGVGEEPLLDLAQGFADTLDKGEGEVPALVKHLPDSESAQERASYAVSLPVLQGHVGQQPALSAIDFVDGTEAVTSTYGPARLVIVEFTTPQIAASNDAKINARIGELKEAGQPVPSAYRRVGNYSVFVFDAPDETTSAQLVGGVSYEKVVQWLGDNPLILQRAQRQYAQTTAGVILAVLKASGLSLLLCLGLGALVGGVVFARRRRAQSGPASVYGDAGGMVRLNLDEMTSQTDPSRLLSSGDR